MKKLIAVGLFSLNCLTYSYAQKLTPWQFNLGAGKVTLPNGQKARTDKRAYLPLVYNYAVIPTKNAQGWNNVPIKDGQISYSTASILSNANYDKFTELDFTYFRAFLDIPGELTVNKATVTIGQVDDQARMLLYNSKHPKGQYIEANDGKRGGNSVINDFTKYVVAGEVNTFVIIQVDDNCCQNNLTGGITVQINNNVIPANGDPKIADKVSENYYQVQNLRAYSINGGSYSDSEPFGLTYDAQKKACVIKEFKKMGENDAYLSIKKIVVDASKNIVAFQVTNAGKPNTYLSLSGTSKDNNRIILKEFNNGPTDDAKFKEVNSLYVDNSRKGFNSYESVRFPNSYLRHESLFLEIDSVPQQVGDLYKKDASWRVEQLK